MNDLCDSCPFARGKAVPGFLTGLPDEVYDEAVESPIPCISEGVKGISKGGYKDTDEVHSLAGTDTVEAPKNRKTMKDRLCSGAGKHHCAASLKLSSGEVSPESGNEEIMSREEFITFHTEDLGSYADHL